MNHQRILKIQHNLPNVVKALNQQFDLPEDSGYFNIIFNVNETAWLDIDGYSQYQRHIETNHIRNKSTHRVLAPNNSGFVKIKSNQGHWKHASTKPTPVN